MKLSLVLLIVGALQLSATVYSQNTKISFTMNDKSVKDVLNEIEKSTDFRFFYNENFTDLNRKVTVEANENSIEDVLNNLLANSDITYKVLENNLIVLTPKAMLQLQSKITGTVRDANTGQAMPGVNVVIEGTAIGTITGMDGKYTLDQPAKNAVVAFSFVGYVTQKITYTGQPVIDVKITPEVTAMEEVVVVGYGTQSKRTLTGSVASLDYDKFKDRSYSNITQALSGELPGVKITQSQGAPGSSPIIKIRGSSSLTAGTNPLFVVDGLPMENFNLNMINSQDIASVDILKDAASAAIYGSRGANGVVLITTKLGKPGKTNVSFTYEWGIQKLPREIKMMDAQQYIQYYIDAHNNAWVASGTGRLASDPNSARTGSNSKYQIYSDFLTDPQQFGTGTDWQSVAFRTAPSENYQLSVSGGTERTQFLISGGYLDQTAILDNNYYKRVAVRANIKQKLSDRFTIGGNLSATGIQDRTDGTLGKVDVVSLALQNSPIFPVYNENGNLGYQDPNSVWHRFALTPNDEALWHPYSQTREIDKKNKTFNTIGTAFLEVNIIKGLTFRSSINGSITNANLNAYQSTNQGWGYGTNSNNPLGVATATYSFNWLTENTLNYEKQIGDHIVKALVGYSAQKQTDEFSLVSANSYPNDLVHTLNAGTVNAGTSSASQWSMLSFLGRINYSYLNRYYLTGTLRRDGSSRFGANNKWGYFPSVSAGWLASDEPFLKDVEFISNLKLKVSYGLSGNNQIPNYGAVALLASGNSNINLNYAASEGANYVFNSNVGTGLMTITIANPDLKWEKTGQFNAGIELGLLKNRINLTAEFYNSITKDLLLNLPVPDITGFATQLTNIGKLRNRGVEINLNTRNLVKEFTWTTDFNFSLNRNTLLQLGPGNAPIIFSSFSAVINEVGQPMNNFYGYKFDGVFKTAAELAAYPHLSTALPGDPKVVDVNGDGVINASDRTNIGNAQPDFIAGMTNTFTYKGIEFSLMLQGSYGGKIVNEQTRYNAVWNGGRNAYAEVANYWKSESDPGDGTHFRPTIDLSADQNQFSTYWISDASFLRVKNIRISYTLPFKWLSRFSVQSTRIYVNLENAFLFSKYKTGYDPENSTYNSTTYSATSNYGTGAPGATATVLAGSYNNNTSNPTLPSGAFAGVDYGSYPIPRVITFGLKLDF
ncbi:MAG: TonB-dependent receptor [Bacteroidales bacterium]